jgi:thiamine kinase-like enzyme
MTSSVTAPHELAVAAQFGIHATQAQPLQDGLINTTVRLTGAQGQHFLLQRVNTRVFTNPQLVQENYQTVFGAIRHIYPLPALIPTTQGELLHWDDAGACWRCFEFVENSYTPKTLEDAHMAFTAAKCFGTFSAELTRQQVKLHTILPQFHDLSLRAQQLRQAKANADAGRLSEARSLLQEAEKYLYLLNHYEHWVKHPDRFPQRILHHDAKVTNILFDVNTHGVICPIDLDTTQPGLFFSDLGDMVRSMVPTHNENHAAIHELDIQTNLLHAIEEGYREATASMFTPDEQDHLYLGGQVLLYMQAIRFLADFLNNDIYYPVQYPGQNLTRAANQFRVLELLKAAQG